MCTSQIFGDFNADYAPVDEENCRLNFAAISDIHIENRFLRKFMLELGLYDMENAEYPLDALVLTGDNTNHGNTDQYEALKEVFAKYNPAREIIMAVGNHDTWNNEDDADNRFPASKDLFIKYSKEITNRDLDNVYYSTVINGYTFIVMSSESDHTAAYISPEQLVWLESEMEKASQSGLPIFVISHWPINGTHGLPYAFEHDKNAEADEGGLGDQSDDVEAILKKYENVFFINGHAHSGITSESQEKLYNYASVESDGSFHSINLPSYMYMSSTGRIANGTGFQFEVYDEQVVIRARSFSAGVWYTLYDTVIPLI